MYVIEAAALTNHGASVDAGLPTPWFRISVCSQGKKHTVLVSHPLAQAQAH